MGYLKKVLKEIPKKGKKSKTSQNFKTIELFPGFYGVGISILIICNVLGRKRMNIANNHVRNEL